MPSGAKVGCILTTLFSQTETTTAVPVDAPKRKKLGWLPLLTVLFCISYGLMTMLIVEQGTTIDAQSALIRELFKDSAELSATKMKAAQEKKAAQNPSVKGQTPSPQAQTNAPLSQVAPQNQGPAGKAPQVEPPRAVSDQTEDRRALVRI